MRLSLTRIGPCVEAYTESTAKVTDYGDENPLLMDYYGFMPQVRKFSFPDASRRRAIGFAC